MKAILWIPKILVIISLIGVALTAIISFAIALAAANLAPQLIQEIPESPIKQPALGLLIVGIAYLLVSILYSDSIEPLSGGIARVSAFVGVTSVLMSYLYFQDYDVLAIIANHNFQGGSRQTLPVFQGLAGIAPWWLLGTSIGVGIGATFSDRTFNIGQVALMVGGAYLTLKVVMILI